MPAFARRRRSLISSLRNIPATGSAEPFPERLLAEASEIGIASILAGMSFSMSPSPGLPQKAWIRGARALPWDRTKIGPRLRYGLDAYDDLIRS